jgi:hypothetical protein
MNKTAKRKPVTPEPSYAADGSCNACVGGWLCAYHQETTARDWNHRQSEIAKASEHLRQLAIDRYAASHELESDEGGTADEKASKAMDAKR